MIKKNFLKSMKFFLNKSSLEPDNKKAYKPPQRYELIRQNTTADRYFDRLQNTLYDFLQHVQNSENTNLYSPSEEQIFWESGKLNPGRPYFFLKPLNESGWLFERSGLGWTISFCEKIVHQNLFLRRYEAWDITNLYMPVEGTEYCRVSSSLFGEQLVSFKIYERKIIEEIWGPDEYSSFQHLSERPIHPDPTF